MELIYAFSGLRFTPHELLEVGHRIQTMRQPHKREGKPRPVETAQRGLALRRKMRCECYEEVGWDPATGAPRRDALG